MTITTEEVRALAEGCEGVQGGPWKLDKFACYIWAPSEKGGDFPLIDEIAEYGRVAELRGWGYYTGHGAGGLGLPPEEAKNRQRLTGEHLARCSPEFILALAQDWERKTMALEKIERWFGEFPPTGEYWDKEKREPISYATQYGSNGERDFMRAIAREALQPLSEKAET